MFTSLRTPCIVLGLLTMASRGWADEAEDRAERYLRDFARRNRVPVYVFREADDDPTRRPFTHVDTVQLAFQVKVTEAEMKQLAAFKHLKHLEIKSPTLTDELLKPIDGLKELVTLELWGQVTDDGLKHLAGFKKLKKLTLRSDRIKGTGLKHLRAYPNNPIRP